MVLGRSRIYTLRGHARGDPFPGIPPALSALSFPIIMKGKKSFLLYIIYAYAAPQKRRFQPEITNLFVKVHFREYFQASKPLIRKAFAIMHRLCVICSRQPMHPLCILYIIFGPLRHTQHRGS